MKKISLSLIAITFAINFSYAQNTNPWPSSGSVGIGTMTPGRTLDVIGTVKATSFNIKGTTSSEVSAIIGTGMGYDPVTYPVSAFGIISGNGVTSIGYNPLANTGGNFFGRRFRNTI